MAQETDERCLALLKDYESLIRRIGSKEAITRRFFIIFEYEPFNGSRNTDEGDAALPWQPLFRQRKPIFSSAEMKS